MENKEMLDFAGDLLERALDGGADDAEVYFYNDLTRKFTYQDRERSGVEFSEGAGFSLRVHAGGRQGFAFLSSPDTGRGEKAVTEALESAGLGDEPAVPFCGPAGRLPDICGLEDPSFHTRPRWERTDFIEGQIEEAFRLSPKVKRVKRAIYTEHLFIKGLLTSSGFRAETGGTAFSLGGSVMAGEGDDREVAHDWTSSRLFGEIAGRRPLAEAAARAVDLLGGKPVGTMTGNVVLHPSVACGILGTFAQALFGDMVARGKSPLKGKLGKAVAASCLTMLDDGLMPGGIYSEPFDDEGVPHRTASVVTDGVLDGYLLDLKSAALLSSEPTGNGGRRDYKSVPSVRPANFHIRPGGLSPAELLERASSGLYILDVMGAHTMDSVSGNISLGASGFVIENGKKGRPFRGVTMAGNLYEMFQRVVAVGDDLRFYREYGSPSLLLEDVDIAGQ